jgi:sulfur carrier protein ThiS
MFPHMPRGGTTGMFISAYSQRFPVPMNIILPDSSRRTVAPAPSTIEQVLTELGINPVEVIVSVNGRLMPEDAIVSGNDEVRIIQVAHGG